LHILDYIVLFGYFILITVYGLWVARKLSGTEGYFRGDRKFKWWIMMGQAFGTGTHAEMPVAQTGASYHLGFATIWYQWKNMLITPFYWLLGPIYRRTNRTTIGEILEDRYGKNIGLVYSVFAIFFFVFNMGAMLQGAAKVISVASNYQISPNAIVIIMTAAFMLYSFFGGLIAAVKTEFIQSFLIIVLSFLLIPLGLKEVDGIAGMKAALPAEFFELYNKTSGLTVFTIAMLALNGIVGITAQPHMVSMYATGNSERAGRVGQTFGSLVKRLCTVGWAFTGLIVAALWVTKGDTLADPELAFGYACKTLLTPGLFGLMIAAIVAANMSTCSNFMVNTGALFTKNLYLKVSKDADDKKLLLIGRLSGLGLAILGVVFALTIKNVLHAFLFTETIAAFMGIIFLGGVLWKGANRYGAIAAILSSFFVYYLLNYMAQGELMLVYKWTPEVFGWAILAGSLFFIIVSLVTKPEDPEKLVVFFGQLEKSSDTKDIEEGNILAKNVGKDLLMVDLPGWFRKERWHNFFQRYKEDLSGFLWSWVMVAILILIAWFIIN